MAARIGQVLVEKGLISAAQLEAALKAQLIYGGRLGSNLVELGYLDVDALAEVMSELLHVPLATSANLEQAPEVVLRLLPKEVAEKYLAFPFAYDGRKLKVAMAEPLNPAVLDALAFATGKRIDPHVAPELRLYFHLERRYGIARPLHYIRLAPERPLLGAAAAGGISPRIEVPARVDEQLFGRIGEQEFLSLDPALEPPAAAVGPVPSPPNAPAPPPASSSRAAPLPVGARPTAPGLSASAGPLPVGARPTAPGLSASAASPGQPAASVRATSPGQPALPGSAQQASGSAPPAPRPAPATSPSQAGARPTGEHARAVARPVSELGGSAQPTPASLATALESTLAAMAEARREEGVAAALLDFCRHRARRALIWVERMGTVLLWRGMGAESREHALEALRIDAEEVTVFLEAALSRKPLVFTGPRTGPDAAIFQAFARLPDQVLVVPVFEGREPSLYLWADSGDAPLSSELLAAAPSLGQAASAALDRIAEQRRKKAALVAAHSS